MRLFSTLAVCVAALALVPCSVSAERAAPIDRLRERVLAEVSAESTVTVGAEQLALAAAYLDTSAEAESLIRKAVAPVDITSFDHFKAHFGKTYPTQAAHDQAKANFDDNQHVIAQLNAAHPAITHAVGPLADLSYEQFLALHTGATVDVSAYPAHANGTAADSEDDEAAEASFLEMDALEAEFDPSSESDYEVNFAELETKVEAEADKAKPVHKKAAPKKHAASKKHTASTGAHKSAAKHHGLKARNLLHHATPIKNQEQCGACADFTTVEVYETLLSLHGHGLHVYSPQQVMDCDHDSSNNGCSGSSTYSHFQFLQHHGGELNSKYPYRAARGKCRHENGSGAKIGGWDSIWAQHGGTEKAIYDAIPKGAIDIFVDASASWQHYRGGIMSPHSCSSSTKKTNHAVTLMGYGSSGGHGYWLVRNHWTASWGEKGYIRLAYGHNTCGMANYAGQAHMPQKPCTFPVPANGNLGGCQKSMPWGSECGINCNAGYTQSMKLSSCDANGHVHRQTCVPVKSTPPS